MANRKIIVLVEEFEAARSALQWAVKNLIRNGDFITLLHVFPSPKSKKRQNQRVLRLKGFQLALSFKDLCDRIPEVKVEIVVAEGDQHPKIVSLVKDIGASALILGLHDQSFLYKAAMPDDCMNNLNCRVLAVKQPARNLRATAEFSQIEIANYCVAEQKSRFQSVPSSFASIWRLRERRGKNA